jgi:hypothetical protein
MAARINDDFMAMEIGGAVIAAAREWADGWREVSYWSGFFDSSHVSIMLTLTGLLDTGRSADAPVVAALQEQPR